MSRPTSWRSLWSRWPIVLVLVLLGLGAGELLRSTVLPRYEATAEVLLEAAPGTELDGRTVGSYGHVIGGRDVVGPAVEALGVQGVTPDDVRSSVVPGTGVLRVEARADRLDAAEELAGAVAEQFTTWLADTQDGLDDDQQVRSRVVDPGTGSTTPVEPRRWPYLLVGGLLGLLLGVGVARWRQVSDKGVTSAEDLEQATGVAVLGAIAHDRSVHEAPLLTSLSPQHPRAEALRILRTNLQFVDVDHDRTVVAVTSAVEAEGKTTTACNLAIALAQSGLRVALVEGDLRRPQLAESFGLESTVGLTTVLVGRVDLDEALQETEVPGLDVLASGARPPNPAEIVQTGAMERLVADLRQRYDVVLIDAPPLLPVADAAILSLLADGALLVVRHGRTGHDQVRAAVDRLDTVGAKLFGSVLSMTPRRAAGRYGYGYEYDQKSSRRRRR